MKPLVSILIPAYNAAEWIAATLRSALAQAWERKEIIVVDDGSTDRTLAIARQYESTCLRVFTQENQGAAAARNKAYMHCQGDYIQWLDADDLLAPNKVSRQMEAVEQGCCKRTLLSSAMGKFMYRCHRATFAATELWRDLSPVEWLLLKMGKNLYMQTGTWLVSRELTEAAGPWDGRLLGDDDGEYFCRVLLASNGTRFVSEAKAYYRCSSRNSLSYIGESDQKLNAQWLSMRLHIDYLMSLEVSERVRAASIKHLQDYSIYFYSLRPDIYNQMKELARKLGGELPMPYLSWKYRWLGVLFGYAFASRARIMLPLARLHLIQTWDKMLYHIEKHRLVAD